MTAMRRTSTGQITLCYREQGAGAVVILLHGTSATLGVWDPVAERLSSGARVVAVDQRGHGRSDKPAAGYRAEDYCADLADLITELGCGPAVVAGHSLGARNALVLAATRPELVAGVVAVDYTPFIPTSVLDELDRRVRGGDRTFAAPTDIAEYLRHRYPRLPEDAIRRRVHYGYGRSGHGFRPLADPNALIQTVAGLRPDFDQHVRTISCPATILRGEHSGIVPAEALAATVRLRPDFRTVTVPGVDHYVPEEDPTVVHDEIVHLLDRLATASATPTPPTTHLG